MLELVFCLLIACVSHFVAERKVEALTHAALLRSADFARLAPVTQRTVTRALRGASRTTGLELAALVALVEGESRFVPWASSGVAYGLGQQVPRFSGKFADRCWCDVTQSPECDRAAATAASLSSHALVRDPAHAARIAARHYLYLRNRYGDDQAAARYFGGSRWQSEAAERYARGFDARRARWARRLAHIVSP